MTSPLSLRASGFAALDRVLDAPLDASGASS
jgi:hypothetical protein